MGATPMAWWLKSSHHDFFQKLLYNRYYGFFLALKLWILIMYIFYKVKRRNAFIQAYLQTLTQDFTFTIKE